MKLLAALLISLTSVQALAEDPSDCGITPGIRSRLKSDCKIEGEESEECALYEASRKDNVDANMCKALKDYAKSVD